MDDEVVRKTHTLKHYFDSDGRCHLESYLGSGAQADVYRIGRNDFNSNSRQRGVVKILREDLSRLGYLKEKEALRVCHSADARAGEACCQD
jgi:hypothetical protein